MSFDEVDLKVLKKFYELSDKRDNFTTWTLMKSIYPNGRDKEHGLIRRRIMRMAEIGLIRLSKEEGIILVKDYIKINEIPTLKTCISLRVNNKWEIFEL